MFANANDLRKNVCFSDVCLHSRKMLQKIFYIVCLEQRKTNPPRNQPQSTKKPTTNHETHNHRNKSPQPTTQDPPRTTSHPPEIKPQTKIHFRQERARSTRGFGCARLTREGGVGLCEIDERG